MFTRTDRRMMMLALAIAVAVVGVAIPTAQMVGCSMDMSHGMPLVMPGNGATFRAACDGIWVSTRGPIGIMSVGFETLLPLLFGATAAAVILFAPRAKARIVVARAKAPPPPLGDPRGERTRI